MSRYGVGPVRVCPAFGVDLKEVMYYLYLPVRGPDLGDGTFQLPANLGPVYPLVIEALHHAMRTGRDARKDYVYVSARKGWATTDNPLNRPGWHCDGFGTDDVNYVWWRGPGTRFAVGDFGVVPEDHKKSIEHFEFHLDERRDWNRRPGCSIVTDAPEAHLYCIDPYVVHATPIIETPCWRQYVKVSFSRHRYNLENNSHNHLFEYTWPMHSREEVRNDTFKSQRDFA